LTDINSASGPLGTPLIAVVVLDGVVSPALEKQPHNISMSFGSSQHQRRMSAIACDGKVGASVEK
jgi:hypothetical protein